RKSNSRRSEESWSGKGATYICRGYAELGRASTGAWPQRLDAWHWGIGYMGAEAKVRDQRLEADGDLWAMGNPRADRVIRGPGRRKHPTLQPEAYATRADPRERLQASKSELQGAGGFGWFGGRFGGSGGAD